MTSKIEQIKKGKKQVYEVCNEVEKTENEYGVVKDEGNVNLPDRKQDSEIDVPK